MTRIMLGLTKFYTKFKERFKTLIVWHLFSSCFVITGSTEHVFQRQVTLYWNVTKNMSYKYFIVSSC